MSKYYVYEYRHPITNTTFYVGKGSGNRMYKHLSETKDNTENYKKWSFIQGLRNKGLEPIIVKVFETNSSTDAYNEESRLIKLYGRKDIDENGILTNICEDNRPPRITGPRSEEIKLKISLAKKGKPNGHLGRKQSLEEIAKRADTMREKFPNGTKGMSGKKHSDAVKQKISESNKAAWTDEMRQNASNKKRGKVFSEEHKANLREARAKQVFTEETKQKMRESQLNRWRNKK